MSVRHGRTSLHNERLLLSRIGGLGREPSPCGSRSQVTILAARQNAYPLGGADYHDAVIIKHCKKQMQWNKNQTAKNLKAVLPITCGCFPLALDSPSVQVLAQQWTASVQV